MNWLGVANVLVTATVIAMTITIPMNDSSGNSAMRVNLGPVATVSLDSDTQIKLREEMPPDFLVYEVWHDGQIILSAYIGNQPKNVPDYRVSSLDGCEAIESIRDFSDGLSRDFLISLGGSKDFPKYLHYFYRYNKSPSVDLADRIIASTKISSTYQCE